MSVFVIAEAGINACGSLVRALRMVEVAHECGADAVKFQSFDVDKLGYADAELNALLRDVRLSKDDHVKLKRRADEIGIEFMSTPFDTDWCDFLVDLGVKRLKISSGKVMDSAFVSHLRAAGPPLIISNGMADAETFRANTQPRDTVLYCVSQYPTPLYKIDLREMGKLRRSYFEVGFSDHTLGIAASVLAAAAGAQVIEKHFTLDSDLPGPDQICSVEPSELTEMIQEIRLVA